MQALIRLLGQQQQGNVMGAMGGTLRTGMQHLGQGMEQQAQQQMGMVQGAPAARLKLAMDRLKQQQAEREAEAETSPQGAQMNASAYQDVTGNAPPSGASPGAMRGGLAAALKAAALDKFKALPGYPVIFDARKGTTRTVTGSDGQPITPTKVSNEREKRKAGLYIGKDLEPSEELITQVESGGVDPHSPGMAQSLTHVADLNRNAAGFADVAQQARELLAKHPNGDLAGTDATRMHSIFTDMKSLYMANLNMKSLRGFDVPILDAALSDPTKLSTLLKSAAGVVDLSAQLEQAVNLAKQRTLSEAAALGYRPTAKGRYSTFKQTTEGAPGAKDTSALRKKYGL